MVLVDTSVWISLYRQDKTDLGQKVWAVVTDNEAALCGQVWVEFVGGFKKEKDRHEYEQSLRIFPFLETTRSAFELAANFVAKYPRLGPGDAIIAATAIANEADLFTLDGDFKLLVSEGLRLF